MKPKIIFLPCWIAATVATKTGLTTNAWRASFRSFSFVFFTLTPLTIDLSSSNVIDSALNCYVIAFSSAKRQNNCPSAAFSSRLANGHAFRCHLCHRCAFSVQCIPSTCKMLSSISWRLQPLAVMTSLSAALQIIYKKSVSALAFVFCWWKVGGRSETLWQPGCIGASGFQYK